MKIRKSNFGTRILKVRFLPSSKMFCSLISDKIRFRPSPFSGTMSVIASFRLWVSQKNSYLLNYEIFLNSLKNVWQVIEFPFHHYITWNSYHFIQVVKLAVKVKKLIKTGLKYDFGEICCVPLLLRILFLDFFLIV